MRTRLAPTPSGYLHLGNLLNFRLTAELARANGLELALRIDDADQTRVRAEYVADIFRWLSALGIAWSIGPRDATELAQRWTQVRRFQRYWRGLRELENAGVELFVCRCSRTELQEGSCQAGCDGKWSEWQMDLNAVRCRPPADLGQAEPVLWRRDGIPAYHLTNLFDDIDLHTTHVVRGADLAEAGPLQQWLNSRLGVSIVYLHHPLLRAIDGSKLSKSQGNARLVDSAELRAVLETEVAANYPSLLADFLAAQH